MGQGGRGWGQIGQGGGGGERWDREEGVGRDGAGMVEVGRDGAGEEDTHDRRVELNRKLQSLKIKVL